MRARTAQVFAGLLILSICGGLLLVNHRRETGGTAVDHGALTDAQFRRAVQIAQGEYAHIDGTLSSAVAYVRWGRVGQPNLAGACDSGHVLVVSLVGDFPHLAVSVSPGAPTGPDTWITVLADAKTGQECVAGVSLGHFAKPSGATDLLPVL